MNPQTALRDGTPAASGLVSAGAPSAASAWPADDSRAAVLYQSEQTRVFRLQLADDTGTIVCKEPLGSHALERLRHEERIVKRLAGIDGVSRLADVAHPAHLIALRDSDGVMLASELHSTPLAVPELLRLAQQLARIVAAVHLAGVVHKDINPTNILLCGAARRPELIDFHIATTLAEEQPGFTHHRSIVGTLAYLAPEQSGRGGLSLDQRADLYALGATFYEMATGQLPFAQGDPLQLIHDHLAQVPTSPIALNPALPPALSEIIVRLLEKEPDRRYQSAEGLAHDLARLDERLTRGDAEPFALGERDFARRLAPPSRLIGRDAEIKALETAFESALHAHNNGVLVAGGPGVGKTALINSLRPIVTARRGWFVRGKFDQFGKDTTSGAVVQALRALARLLLAEPLVELAAQRERLLAALGPNAGLFSVPSLPEFMLLLGPQPEVPTIDPGAAEARLLLATLDLLRAVASPTRPVVMVLDDLQWAGALSVRFIDQVLSGGHMPGLLLVGAYRSAEVDATHPLSALLAGWEQLGTAPLQLPLHNLATPDLSALLADMLRLAPLPAAQLADAVGANTHGNPFDTVELVNALRRDGALVSSDDGWHWDAATIRRYIGQGNVVDLLATRIARLPAAAQQLLEVIACLGGEVALPLLQAASGLPLALLDEQLAAPLEDGLLVLEPGETGGLRYRHDRVQQAAYAALAPAEREPLHLAIARRLAAVTGFDTAAAGQYHKAVREIADPDERRRVAGLFAQTAAQAVRSTSYAVGERYLGAALGLLAGIARTEDEPLLLSLQAAHHVALYSLGRLEQADIAYAAIAQRCRDPLELIEPACVQVASVSNRGRQQEAVGLGLALLERLGISLVSAQTGAQRGETAPLRDPMHDWAHTANLAADLQRPEVNDPRVIAAAKLIKCLVPAAFFCDPAVYGGLALEARRLWVEHGPCPHLLMSIVGTSDFSVEAQQDYHTPYVAGRYALAVGEARGYEPQTSQTRHVFSLLAVHWYEAIEEATRHAQLAREGLLRGGDLQYACFTCYVSIAASLESAPTLDAHATDVDAGLAFAAHTGNHHATAAFVAFRQLLRALRGETSAPGSFTDAGFDESAHLAGLSANPMAQAYFHIYRALAAALFGDAPALARHAAAALPLLPVAIPRFYPTALAQLLQALALAQQVKAAVPAQRSALLAELDVCRDWLALRAADAPANFRQLLKLVEAERAWAVDDFQAAACLFDAALHGPKARQRPWHQALIAERAGLFHLTQGMEHTGRVLLSEARGLYKAWGASAKLRQLDRDHGFLRSAHASLRDRVPGHSTAISADAFDLLAVLRASQALSSETSLARLEISVVELLGTLTGATAVRLVLWDAEAKDWFVSVQEQPHATPLSVAQAAARGLLPLSAFSYVERTREPLLVDDAIADDRFARDPYFSGHPQCSLLLVPIDSQGAPRAILLLENRLCRNAFSVDRLDAVKLITGQLAVSLNNVLLYESLERKVAERTEALAEANHRLERLSVTDALTGLANRRRFDEVLAAESLRALRPKSSIGLAMIDIDQFKQYNDHYGHAAGDACLRRVAAAMASAPRLASDLVARYGGEEFCLVLPNTDLAAAAAAAERIRAAVLALDEPHVKSDHGIVTISIGVAAFVPADGNDAQSCLQRADAVLYEAKRLGRNRITIADN